MNNHASQLKLSDVLEQRRTHVEEKQQQRAERYEGLVEKHQKASTQRFQTAKQMAECIPFGQPVLVGHHSEKSDRAFRKRIDQNMRKSIEHDEAAKHYDQKLKSMQSNHAISADDPEALQKLEAKLERLVHDHEEMKRVNKILRSTKKLSGQARVQAVAEQLDISQEKAQKFLTPDYSGKVGIPAYALSNSNANIRATRERIAQIKADHERIATQGESAEQRHDELGLSVIENNIVNRIQLQFDRRLTKDAYALVREYAFNRTKEGIFQRKLNNNGRYAVHQVIAALKKLPEVLEPKQEPKPQPKTVHTEPQPQCCGYCGAVYPPETTQTFCDRCIASPHLTPEHYHLLRLQPKTSGYAKRPKLSEHESAELSTVITQAQLHASQERAKQVAQKKRTDIKQDFEKAVQKATTEFEGFTWLLDHEINTENCIFYGHTLTFCFGWQSPITRELKASLETALKDFPFKVKYEVCSTG